MDLDNPCGCPECLDLIEAVRYLYAHEINVSITSFWDGGFDVKIGDAANGFVAIQNFDADDMWKAGNWMVAVAKEKYPDGEWKPK